MGWVAAEKLGPAFEEAKEMLLPFDLGRWLRLGVIVMFTGTGISLPTPPAGGGGSSPGVTETASAAGGEIQSVIGSSAPSPTALATASPSGVILLAAAALTAVVLLLYLFSSVMELVFYRVLMERDARIRSKFSRLFRPGGSYFLLRLGFIIASLLVLGAAIAGLILSLPVGLLALLPAVLAVLAGAVLMRLVHTFAVPHSAKEKTGIVESIRYLYPELRGEWRELAVYLVIRLVIGVVAGVAMLSWILLISLAGLLILGLPSYLIYTAFEPLGVLLFLLSVLAWLLFLLAGKVAVQVYTYSHALLVYQELSPGE